MDHTVITKADLVRLIDAWSTADRIYDKVNKLAGDSSVTGECEAALESILSVDTLIRGAVPLFRHPDGADRTDEEEETISRILRSSIPAEEKAEKLLSGTDPAQTLYAGSGKALLDACCQGIQQLEALCAIPDIQKDLCTLKGLVC